MPDASANYRGIRYLLLATTCLALNDTCNKFLVGDLPSSQIIVLRAIISLVIVFSVIAARGELASLRAMSRPDIIVRSMAESWIGPFLITAFAFMHQADATAIYMVAPVFVALIGFGHFKEKFSWPLLLAGLLACAGAWLFVNPQGGVIRWVALLPIAAACCQVLREATSRTMGRKAEGGTPVSNRVVLFSTAVFSILAGTILALFFPWITPVQSWRWLSPFEFLLLLTASGLFYVGVTYSYEAYRGSDLSVVASFRYWYLLVAIVAGFIVFGDLPSAQSLLGMTIIVAAGVLVVWQQRASSKP